MKSDTPNNSDLSLEEIQMIEQFQTMTIEFVPFLNQSSSEVNIEDERILNEFYQEKISTKKFKKEVRCEKCIFGVKETWVLKEESIDKEECGICFLKRINCEKQRSMHSKTAKNNQNERTVINKEMKSLVNMFERMEIKEKKGTKKSIVERIVSLFFREDLTHNLNYEEILKHIRIENVNKAFVSSEDEMPSLRIKIKKAIKSLIYSGLICYKKDSGTYPILELNLDYLPKALKEALIQKFITKKVEPSALKQKFKLIEFVPELNRKEEIPHGSFFNSKWPISEEREEEIEPIDEEFHLRGYDFEVKNGECFLG